MPRNSDASQADVRVPDIAAALERAERLRRRETERATRAAAWRLSRLFAGLPMRPAGLRARDRAGSSDQASTTLS